MPIWLAIWTAGSVPGVAVPDALGGRERGGGVVAEDLALPAATPASGAVVTVGHRAREQPVHRRRVMVRQVVVDRAWGDGLRLRRG